MKGAYAYHQSATRPADPQYNVLYVIWYMYAVLYVYVMHRQCSIVSSREGIHSFTILYVYVMETILLSSVVYGHEHY